MRPSMAHSAAADLQCAHGVLLVRPACFGYNTQTAASNRFQQPAQLPDTAERADWLHDVEQGLRRNP